MRVALITGITGQDGYYLARQLAARGDQVVGLVRPGAPAAAGFGGRTIAADLGDQAALTHAVAAAAPDEVYHLAAQSSVSAAWAEPVMTGDITGLGAARLLEAVRQARPQARVVLVSSSEVFGAPAASPQTEATPHAPVSPYGAAKAYAHALGRIYRDRHGLFVAIAIPYNHESPRRPPGFVSRKIAQGAVAIARGAASSLALGNLDARRDWGYAPDYTRAMHAMLALAAPEEFILATGETHSVRDWCELAFARVGLDYRQHVTVDPALWRPEPPAPLVGDSSQARAAGGWRPTISCTQLVHRLVDAELGAIRSC